MFGIRKKLIITMAVVLIVGINLTYVSATDMLFDKSVPGGGIKDINGYITIKGILNVEGERPVTVIVAPQILDEDGETDITAESIESAVTIEQFLNVVEYSQTISLLENGEINLAFYVKDSMPTGVANVYVGYNGGNGIEYIGHFEHVGKNDVSALVAKFNNGDDYVGYINADIEGNELLRKLFANVSGYSSLLAKDKFASVMYSLKGENDFTAITLVDSFNEAVAWIELREKADTLFVLNSYNNIYWDVELSEGSDFGKLLPAAQGEVLDAIKKAGCTDAENLLSTLTNETALANFRLLDDRNALAELLSNEKYKNYFEKAQQEISEANINEYDLISVYNYILTKNADCYKKENMEELFEDAIESVTKKDGTSDGGGGSSSGSKDTSDVVLTVPGVVTEIDPEEGFIKVTEHPFKDVKKEHWANGYITQMYKAGIISGKSTDSFAPEDKIVRQDFVKMIVAMLGTAQSERESIFEDVEKDSFYEPYIMAAVDAGIINGVSEKNFGMSANIKRQDVAVILGRILANKGITSDGDVAFTDSSDIASYAQDAVKLTATSGLFKGDDSGRINPNGELSRAEAAALLVRLSEVLNK